MTATAGSSKVARAFAILGPWPLRPGILGGGMFMLYVVAVLGWTSTRTPLVEPAILLGVIPAALAGVAIFLIATAGRTWQRRHGVRWSSYAVSVLGMAMVAPIIREVVPFTPDLPPGAPGVLGAMGRGIVGVVALSSLAGHLTRRLENQVAATQEALDAAHEQQRRIIAADEEARRQAALLLHDRVQARLITVCLELRTLAERLAPAERADLEPLIERLETVRSLDLRSASRSLSPNLEDVDLQTAIEELAVAFEPAFTVTVHVDPRIDEARFDIDSQALLACYRIVEQGLINTAAHAHAAHVDVRIDRVRGALHVAVADDGRGMPPSIGRGLGSAIVNAWVQSVGGSWGWRPTAGGPGTVLFAELDSTALRS